MITQRVWFAVIPVVTLVAGSTACVSKTMSAHGALPSITSTAIGGVGDVSGSARQPQLDVYGNEIEEAITDYRIDRGGVVYERHSPDTEVPHLRPPLM